MGEWRRQLQRKVMMASLLGRKRGKKCGSTKERKRLQIKRKQTGAGKKEQMAKKDSKAKKAMKAKKNKKNKKKDKKKDKKKGKKKKSKKKKRDPNSSSNNSSSSSSSSCSSSSSSSSLLESNPEPRYPSRMMRLLRRQLAQGSKVLAQAESQVGLAKSQPMPHLVPLAKPTTPADLKAQWQEMPAGGKCMVTPPPPKLTQTKTTGNDTSRCGGFGE